MTRAVSAAFATTAGRVRTARRSASGTSAGPGSSAIVLRLVVLAAGWATLLLSVPSPVYRYAPVVVVVTGILAAATAVVPRRHAALVLELGGVALWLLPGGHPGSTALTSVVLAALIYLHHATAALAAATGWDVRTTRSLARGWSVRTAGIVVTASAISVVMLLLSRRRLRSSRTRRSSPGSRRRCWRSRCRCFGCAERSVYLSRAAGLWISTHVHRLRLRRTSCPLPRVRPPPAHRSPQPPHPSFPHPDADGDDPDEVDPPDESTSRPRRQRLRCRHGSNPDR